MSVFVVFVVILALILVLFFLFSVLLPAMKSASFSVDVPLFSDSELAGEGGGKDAKAVVPMTGDVAVVSCGACAEIDENITSFDRTHSCRTVHEVCLSLSDCDMMCIGAGDCAAVCPQGAIVMRQCGARRIAMVTDLCIGCGKCVDVCPQHTIKMVKRGTVSTECANGMRQIEIHQSKTNPSEMPSSTNDVSEHLHETSSGADVSHHSASKHTAASPHQPQKTEPHQPPAASEAGHAIGKSRSPTKR